MINAVPRSFSEVVVRRFLLRWLAGKEGAKMKPWKVTLALVLLLGGNLRADTIYDTTPSWNGVDSISQWGSAQSGFTATYGQTFVAPSIDNVLQSFTFYINGATPGTEGSVTFQADVYAWSGSLQGGHSPQGSTGSPVYTSANMTFTDNGTFQPVTINTGGIALVPGQDYVALFTTSDPTSIAANASSLGAFAFGDTGFSHVANDGGGGFNFFNNTASSQLSTPPWDDFRDFGDLAWTADFTSSSATPEPASLALLSFGIASVAGWYRWRRRVASM